MLSVLLLMGVAFSITMRTERAGASNMRHAAMARHILDSALARTMADLDRALEEQGDLPVPTGGVIVTVSSKPGGAANVNPLCYEASLHLPPDQLIAAVYTNAQWLPIYGDVRITSNDKNDPASADSPVGRYAYVILNGCGYLDPNIVGDSNSNRLYGLTPYEIDIEGDNGNVLGMDHADDAHRFLETRDDMGHFATMGDFLTAANNKHAITNLLGLVGMDVDNKRFPTNSFFVGSLALDDLAPPTGVQKVGQGDAARYYPIRKPKFALRELDSKGNPVMIDPKDLIKDSDWCDEFREAMTNSFLATYEGQKKNPPSNVNGKLPKNYTDPHNDNRTFYYPLLAARNLLEMMDRDGCPGGSKKRAFSQIGAPGSENEDEYLKAFGEPNWNWDRLPCVEPVPLLDNLVILGGDLGGGETGDQEAGQTSRVFSPLSYKPHHLEIVDETGTKPGNVTNIEFTVTLSVVSAPIYTGWNVPDGAEGDFTFMWRIFFPGPSTGWVYSFSSENADILKNSKYKRFFDGLEASLSASYEDVEFEVKLERDKTSRVKEYPSAWRMAGEGRTLTKEIKFSIDINPGENIPDVDADNLGEFVPDDFGLVVDAVGVMGRGDKDSYKNDIVQVVPCQEGTLGTTVKIGGATPSFFEIPLVIKRSSALRFDEKGSEDAMPVLGAVYALDPRFAFKWNSWLWLPARSEKNDADSNPLVALGETLRDDTLDSLTILRDELNPLSQKYLQNPYNKFAGETLFEIMGENMLMGVFGGVSDEMRAMPQPSTIAGKVAERSARTVFFDPNMTEPANPDDPSWSWAFTRVGQLGNVPIGTFRTIALIDGFDNIENGDAHLEVRQRVLDYFTMNPPRDPGSKGSGNNMGDPVKSAKFISRVGLNPPLFPEVEKNKVVPGDPNLLPLAAALNGCPLREWQKNNNGEIEFKLDWDMALNIADAYADSLERKDSGLKNADGIIKPSDVSDDAWDQFWDKESDIRGITRSLSALGRSTTEDGENTIGTILLDTAKYADTSDFDREGVIRNTAEMLTTRQQLFTILLKADSFTPMFGFADADHGTALASVQAIAHVWRDPEPLRDADGKVILDNPDKPDQGHPIHAWVLLDLYQF